MIAADARVAIFNPLHIVGNRERRHVVEFLFERQLKAARVAVIRLTRCSHGSVVLQTLILHPVSATTAAEDLLLIIRRQTRRVVRDEVPVCTHFKTRGHQRLDLRPSPLPRIHNIQ